MKCIICGKQSKPRESAKYEFSHGTINVCYSCRPTLMYELDGGNVPIGWLCSEDLYNPDIREAVTKEEGENLTREDVILFANHMEEILAEDTDCTGLYESLIEKALPYWRRDKEEELVNNTPPEKLPLLIGNLKFDENKELLEQRLKGEPNE